jgi:inhibitor of KinA
MSVNVYPLGECAAVVDWGRGIEPQTHRKVRALTARLESCPLPGQIEVVPAFTTVTVFYDSYFLFRYGEQYKNESGSVGGSAYEWVRGQLLALLEQLEDGLDESGEKVEIPVCYGGEFGPDLDAVATYCGLTPGEVIDIHSRGEYRIYMIGFAPGFPYLGGMSRKIAVPRREVPRLSIPAGSVGIAGMQTGVYPIATPGGWQLIGRTPLALFRPHQDPPSLLKAGQTVKFVPISPADYERLKEGRS